MDEIDQIFVALGKAPVGYSPTIACLYTGVVPPSSCAPMLRLPTPPIGHALDFTFIKHLKAALKLNEAIHDGAVMFGREAEGATYGLVGWSYRLFPGEAETDRVPNRGSAFNSCIAMSVVENIDRLYLVTPKGGSRFVNGMATELV